MKTRQETARNASVSIAMQKVHHNQTGKFPATDVRQRSRGVDSIIGTIDQPAQTAAWEGLKSPPNCSAIPWVPARQAKTMPSTIAHLGEPVRDSFASVLVRLNER